MNLTELRVGNFVSEGGKGAYRVVSVSKESVFMEVPKIKMKLWLNEGDKTHMKPWVSEWKNYARNIEPVPITAEWLERLGFRVVQKRYKTAGFIDKYSIEFDLTHHSFTHALDEDTVDPIYYEVIPRIHYVHQLQNLVFALTGEELEVKGGAK